MASEKLILTCVCLGCDDVVQVHADYAFRSLDFNVALSPYLTFFKRFKVAVCYLLGLECLEVAYDVVCVEDRSQLTTLRDMCNRLLEGNDPTA